MKRVGALNIDSDHFTNGFAEEQTDRNLISGDNHSRIKGHLNQRNINTKISLILFGVVVLILTGILFKPRVFRTIPFKEVSTPANTGMAKLPHRNLSNAPVSETLFGAAGIFNEEIVEVKDWMLNLDGWLDGQTIAKKTIFAKEPFIALQPWMVHSEEWLNPGYFEEMVTVEPWMTSIDGWSERSTLWEESFIQPDEWMTDIALWSGSDFDRMAAADFNEEAVSVESWMLDVEGWIKSRQGENAIRSGSFEEVDIEVRPWMMSLEKWNTPHSTNAGNNNETARY